MQEQRIAVRRTARYYTLGPGNSPEAWIACHGYSQLARYFARPFKALDDGARRILVPEALNRYYSETSPGVHAADARVGATWMTREYRDAEIGDYVHYLDELAKVEAAGAERVIALGFSQGAATVSRWAALGTARLDHVVFWGTGPAHDLELSAASFRTARVTIVAGDADEYFDIGRAERTAERLRSAGLECEVLGYAGGHRVTEDALRELADRLRA